MFSIISIFFETMVLTSCSNQVGPAPALIKAEVPWSVRRGNLSEEERVLKTVKGYVVI
jgi:hypothetical protein